MTGIVIVGVGIGFIIAALTFLLLFRKAKDRESKKAEEASAAAEKAEAQARSLQGTNAKTASKEEASVANQEE